VSEQSFKVGILGPSRVGKTSLITAILSDSQKLLAGTSLAMKYEDTSPTGIRINRYKKDLRGDINAGEFEPGKLGGSQEPFTFELEVDAGLEHSKLHLSILDYPGGWLDPENRPPGRDTDWKNCQTWIENSTVLIIPIDATVLMEAYEPKHKRAVPSILGVDDVVTVARSWAKKQRDKPIVLMMCPVKCESYFNDNGGTRDRSDKLYEKTLELYIDVVEVVRQESTNVTVMYMPIDTIGCVDLMSAEWQVDDRATGGFDFSVKYRILKPVNRGVLGADSVLFYICEHIISLISAAMEKIKIENGNEIDKLEAILEKMRNPQAFEDWLNLIVKTVSGERSRLERGINILKGEAEKIGTDLDNIENIVNEIRKRQLSHQRAKVVR
jgi:hypothetical protein